MGIAPRTIRHIQFRNRATRISRSVHQRQKMVDGRGNSLKVHPRDLMPRGRSFLMISPFSGSIPRTIDEIAAILAGDIYDESAPKLIVAVAKLVQDKIKTLQSSEGKQFIAQKDKFAILNGMPGGAKTESQMIEAIGTANNVTASIPDADIKQEVDLTLKMPRDDKGRIIYFDSNGQFFYVYDTHSGSYEAERVEVYIEMRPAPSGLCTTDFPSGMIPILFTVLAASLKSK